MSEEKRMLGNYEVTQSIYVGDKEVVLAVDKKEQYPFLVCYCDYHNPLSAAWATEGVASDDYLEAMEIFTERVQSQIDRTRAELSKFPFDKAVFTKEHCIPDDHKSNIVGKVVVLNAEPKRYEYQHPAYQLILAEGATVQQAAEVRRCLVLALPRAKEPDGKGTMCLGKSSPNVCPIGQKKPLPKSRGRKKPRSTRI